MTLDGSPLPETNDYYDGATFYLVAEDTDAWHRVADYSYRGLGGSRYILRSDRYESRIIPGTYDVLYRRGHDTSTHTVSKTEADERQINGLRVLQACRVVP